MLLVAVVILPLLVVQAGVYITWYYTRWTEEEQSRLTAAYAVGMAMDAFVRDVLRQEAAIGAALVSLSPSAHDADEFLASAQREYPSVQSWNWIGPDGKAIASSDTKGVGVDYSDREYFRKLRSVEEKWFVSDILKDRVRSNPTFVIARAIRRLDDTLVGVVSATIAVRDFGIQIMEEHEALGTVTVFDRRGVLVYSGDAGAGDFTDWRDKGSAVARST